MLELLQTWRKHPASGPIPEPQCYASTLKEYGVHRKENLREAGNSMHRGTGSVAEPEERSGGGTQVGNDGLL